MSAREVAITGLGLLTPLGAEVDENWTNVKARKTGIERHATKRLPPFFQYFGRAREFEPKVPESPGLANQMKFLNRGSLLGFAAACEALEQARTENSAIDPERRAVYIASDDFTKLGYEFLYPAIEDATVDGWEGIDPERLNQALLTKVNPFFLLESMSNNLFSFLSAYFELRGANSSLASLSPCGSQALELAFRSVQHGRADAALAVGCGTWVTEIPLYELEGLGLLSRCALGATSFKPFDRSRDGFIPGEGSAAVFLEAAEVARARNAKILGTIQGCGNSIELADRGGLAVPESVCRRSMELALAEAGVALGDLAFIGAHGSATQQGDRSELRSILDLQQSQKSSAPIVGLKPYTGHMGAASDIAEIVLGLKSVGEGLVPATLNFATAEKEFYELKISEHRQISRKNAFMSVSYGLGGQSSSVVVAGS